jgi:hypothetical protein
LGEPDRIEATRQLADVFQLPRNEFHLFVDVSELPRRLMCKQKKENKSTNKKSQTSERSVCVRARGAQLGSERERTKVARLSSFASESM